MSNPPNVHTNCCYRCKDHDKCLEKIAALELALRTCTVCICVIDGHDPKNKECDKNISDQALLGSKLADLFQALLEEHSNSQSFCSDIDKYEKVEALRKEVGL